MKSRLDEKVALITGGTSGIGRATAFALARAGARMVIGDIRERPIGEGAATADIIRQRGGKALFVETDVAQRSQVEALIEKAIQELGRIDILVNNAGIGQVSSAEHTPDKVLKQLVEVNFYGVVYGVQAVLPVMRAQRSGHIINVASGAAMIGLPYTSIYAATKAAIARLSEGLRCELEDSNIEVSVIYPDFTATDLALAVTPAAGMRTRTVRSLNPEGVEKYGHPIFRLQSPEDVGQAVLACVLRPRSEVYLSPRIRFHGLFQSLFPAVVERESRRVKRSLEQFLEKVCRDDGKTPEAPVPQNCETVD